MQFKNEEELNRLVIDETVEGFRARFRDADYYLFLEKKNDWEQVPQVQNIAWGKQRVKGIRRNTEFTLSVAESDNIRLDNNHPVYGTVGITWKVTLPRKAIETSGSISTALLNHISEALARIVHKYAINNFAANQESIKMALESQVQRKFRSDYGVEVKISKLNLSHRIQEIVVQTDTAMAGQQGRHLLEKREQDHTLSLSDQRRRQELLLSGLEQRQQIQLDAERILATGNAHVGVEQTQWRLLQEKIQAVLGPQADPILAIGIMMGENVVRDLINARATAQQYMLEYQLKDKELDILNTYARSRLRSNQPVLDSYLPRSMGTSSALNPSSTSGLLLPESGETVARIQQALPSECKVTARPENSGTVYRVEYSAPNQLVIELLFVGGQIKKASYGTTGPNKKWGGPLPDSGDIIQVATQVVRNIYHDAQSHRSGRK